MLSPISFDTSPSGKAIAVPAQYDSLVVDDFDSTTLDPAWTWGEPQEGPGWSLTEKPGFFQFTVPPGFEHWEGVNSAPSLRRTDMGNGSFAIETGFEFGDDPGGGYQFGLVVGFSEMDRLWMGVNEDGSLHVQRTGADNSQIGVTGLPVQMRIEKTGAEYKFLYREDANDPWMSLVTYVSFKKVSWVGVQGRTYAADDNVTYNLDYFRLERGASPGGGTPPPPIPTVPPVWEDSQVEIEYEYDPLGRLVEANYSNGNYYHYDYDAVGNRLAQETLVGVSQTTTTYSYDDANRLMDVNGIPYTWDYNGNLLSDGVNTYTYDSANRLISVSGQSSVSSYQYTGLGDRISQTVNGVTTNYTLDLNTGLTQVLSDGTTDYLYGLGRIAQVGSDSEYFLGDALGSVRQMTDTNGEITFARGYDPYGVVTYTTGTSQTEFGFTGEQYGDSTQLLYLRARHYSPADGRFTSRDTWSGDVNRPLSLNRWNYTHSNPINYTDPSGHCQRPDGSWDWLQLPLFGPCPSLAAGPIWDRITYTDQEEYVCDPLLLLIENPPQSQTVNIIHIAGPNSKPDGSYDWQVKFQLEQPAVADGWIVQEVVANFQKYDSVSNSWVDRFTYYPSQYHFWEAWPVKKGERTSSESRGIFGYNDQYYSAGSTSTALIGRTLINGTVKFYTGGRKSTTGWPTDDVPSGQGWGNWKRNNPDTLADFLASTTNAPSFWDYCGTPHNLEAYWDHQTSWGSIRWGNNVSTWGTPQTFGVP